MRPEITRRAFVAGAAALAASPALGQMPASGEVDVAIVGAGTAGIAAARRIAAAGQSYALLEATGRIGGRVRSARTPFGAPYDAGAGRLYGGSRNGLLQAVRAEPLRLFQPPPGRRLYIGAREARDNEYDDFVAALRGASRAIAAAAEAGRDVAAARVLPEMPVWHATVSFVLGPLFCAKDLEEVSAVDFARAEDRAEETGCRDGLADVLSVAARGLSVERETPVTAIDIGARGALVLETARGAIRAHAVILTPSTDVLRSRIEFRPALPRRVVDALSRLSLGVHDRIVFELPGNPYGFRPDERIVLKLADARALALVGRVNGSDTAYAEFAGGVGRELARSGERIMLEFFREFLTAQFGGSARSRIGRTEVVRWSAEPYVQGGFSVAAPGAATSRRVLMEPVADRMFLAGEAVHETAWGTVGGAWASGERAAEAALKYLARAPAVAAPAPAAKQKKKK